MLPWRTRWLKYAHGWHFGIGWHPVYGGGFVTLSLGWWSFEFVVPFFGTKRGGGLS